ncbi:MAG: tetratricopeptide repeat protein, partial [Verrucomicrobiae bacterium]|nr:tetratricopeptide repeat protein [Verrucomicrobiae bacterium]
ADAHFSLNNIPKAEAAYREFAALYPDDKSAVDVGLAKIAITQKKPDDALKLLVGFETLAPKVASPTAAQERAFSEAFYLLGQVYEQKNDSQKALVSYLKSAAIYSGYENVSAKAQERADMLRKAQNREKEAPALYVP